MQAETTLQYNQSRSCVFGVNDCSVPWEEVALPLQLAVERALLSQFAAVGRGADASLSLGMSYQPFPNPEMVEQQRKFDQEFGQIFVVMGVLFTFYTQVRAVPRPF